MKHHNNNCMHDRTSCDDDGVSRASIVTIPHCPTARTITVSSSSLIASVSSSSGKSSEASSGSSSDSPPDVDFLFTASLDDLIELSTDIDSINDSLDERSVSALDSLCFSSSRVCGGAVSSIDIRNRGSGSAGKPGGGDTATTTTINNNNTNTKSTSNRIRSGIGSTCVSRIHPDSSDAFHPCSSFSSMQVEDVPPSSSSSTRGGRRGEKGAGRGFDGESTTTANHHVDPKDSSLAPPSLHFLDRASEQMRNRGVGGSGVFEARGGIGENKTSITPRSVRNTKTMEKRGNFTPREQCAPSTIKRETKSLRIATSAPLTMSVVRLSRQSLVNNHTRRNNTKMNDNIIHNNTRGGGDFDHYSDGVSIQMGSESKLPATKPRRLRTMSSEEKSRRSGSENVAYEEKSQPPPPSPTRYPPPPLYDTTCSSCPNHDTRATPGSKISNPGCSGRSGLDDSAPAEQEECRTRRWCEEQEDCKKGMQQQQHRDDVIRVNSNEGVRQEGNHHEPSGQSFWNNNNYNNGDGGAGGSSDNRIDPQMFLRLLKEIKMKEKRRRKRALAIREELMGTREPGHKEREMKTDTSRPSVDLIERSKSMNHNYAANSTTEEMPKVSGRNPGSPHTALHVTSSNTSFNEDSSSDTSSTGTNAGREASPATKLHTSFDREKEPAEGCCLIM